MHSPLNHHHRIFPQLTAPNISLFSSLSHSVTQFNHELIIYCYDCKLLFILYSKIWRKQWTDFYFFDFQDSEIDTRNWMKESLLFDWYKDESNGIRLVEWISQTGNAHWQEFLTCGVDKYLCISFIYLFSFL